MRVTCYFVFLFVCIASARSQNGTPRTPGERYLTQVTATLEKAMTSQFGQRLYKIGNAKLHLSPSHRARWPNRSI